MTTNLFISYAWTSDEHRQWVRLLTAQLKALGYGVLIDADLDYGDSLTGFMRKVTDAKHVLLIVDENYVDRANTAPDSGVAAENRWISEVFPDRPSTWLSVLFKDNPSFRLPNWLADRNPKGHSFNYDPSRPNDFAGSEQVEDLWRWIEGLPANRDHATPIATLRERAARLERQALKTDPARWRSPQLQGQIRFVYQDVPDNTFRWGYGNSEFAFNVSECGVDSIYIYKNPIKAVGVVRGADTSITALERYLSSGRSVVAKVGDTVVLMNEDGRLALVEITGVQREETGTPYVAPYVEFTWRVVDGSWSIVWHRTGLSASL